MIALNVLFVALLGATDFPATGVDTTKNTWFEQWYHQGQLSHYLDNINDYTVYQIQTVGRWDNADQMVFSIQGNNFQWNRIYQNGFRIDQRFTAGSTVYRPNMMYNTLVLDTHEGSVNLFNASDKNFVSATYNIGGLGGISPGTNAIMHPSAVERSLYPQAGLDIRDYRSHLAGAGEVELQYAIPNSDKTRTYRQHLYANGGLRRIVALNEQGIYGLYNDPYWKVQADGRLPLGQADTAIALNYLLNISHRSAMGSEFNYNPNEVLVNNTYTGSLYLTNLVRSAQTQWTAGVTWATNTHRRDNTFTRNIVDQDGEAFEIWMPNGATNELDFSATLNHQFLPWLSLHYEGYNSMISFDPDEKKWTNQVVWKSLFGNENYDLYRINWQSNNFSGGILENTLGLNFDYQPLDYLRLTANVDATLDGVLLGKGKSFVRPNWQAKIGVDIHPTDWFQIGFNIANYRIAFNIETLRYFSNDYLNGTITYPDGTLFATTGGAYHSLDKHVWQPSYALIDIPISFRFGKERRHEIAILSSYKKFYHLWTTRFDTGADNYGYYLPTQVADQEQTDMIYFLNAGTQNYVVNYQQPEELGSGFFTNTAWWASNMIKYSYTGKKVYVMLSWQSFMGSGVAALGNGPIHNNIGMLSESQANPNMKLVTMNPGPSIYKQVGRIDQDKAYLGRIMVAYNITDEWQIGMTFKFADGQPFSSFSYQFETDQNNHTQVALWNRRSKGTNPSDGNFGSRKDSFFNLDFNLAYKGHIGQKRWMIQLYGYNLYDFGSEYAEYTFIENNQGGNRDALMLTIPRGLMAHLMFEL